MSRRKVKKWQPRPGRQAQRTLCSYSVVAIDAEETGKRERYFELFLMATLLAFGVYQSVLYFGHTIVPNSDFPAFFRTGQDILSFRTPASFKRVPVLGMLQVLLSYLVGGQHPGLTAGWLLNAILHPFNLVLFWLVGRELIGKSALWFAVIAILNPQVLYLLTEPIAETTLLFFILLTFYFIFKRSNWCYVFASITTMVRYEGAALIVAAFVMDMIHYKSKQERTRAFLYSALASVPLAIWMLGTIINWQSETSHYLSLFGQDYSKLYVESAESRTGFTKHMNVLWDTGFYPLLTPYSGAGKGFAEMLWKVSKTVCVASFFFGAVYGLCKRKWSILALLIFFVPYFWIHARFPSPLRRYHMPVFWIALLICWFGLQSAWRLIEAKGRIPKVVGLVLQGLVIAAALVWLIQLVPGLSAASGMSPKSAALPWLAMIVVGLIAAGRTLIYGRGALLRESAILGVMCLIIVSNQFALVRTIGDGQREKEFKELADWYIANAKPGEKLGVYMAPVVKIFAPAFAEYIVALPQAETPAQFIKACYEQDITYVVWATREGMTADHTSYRQIGLHKNIAHLREPKNIGPYQFVAQVGWERGYVNIFRLIKPADTEGQKPPGG
jgi:hypothetical protein